MILSPEAALANHIAKRHDFQPGNELQDLVALYADIEYLQFPVEAVDGISLYLKSPERRPNIIINSSIPNTRAKFTLAHEFGHVIIPWHFGMVFSNIDKFTRSADAAYREMESEANRFAAELLMPHAWLQELHDQSHDPVAVTEAALQTCGTSMASVIIAVNNSLPPGYVYVRTRGDGIVRSSTSSYGTFVASFDEGEDFTDSAAIDECSAVHKFEYKGAVHLWLAFETEKEIEVESDERSWRDIFDELISDVEAEDIQGNIKASVNAIISTCNKPGTSPEAFYAAARQKLVGRGEPYESILAHPKFNTFLAKKIAEFMARRK